MRLAKTRQKFFCEDAQQLDYSSKAQKPPPATQPAPLLSSRASQEEELADSISKNGSLSGTAELVSPITARKISRKHQYEYPSQIAINMSRLRRLVVSLGLLWFSTFFKNGHLKVHGFMDNNTQ